MNKAIYYRFLIFVHFQSRFGKSSELRGNISPQLIFMFLCFFHRELDLSNQISIFRGAIK
jgi:hypothetical protein